MILNLHVVGPASNVAQFGEALQLALRVTTEGAGVLPDWLRQEFTPESTPDEKARWLNEWRMESDEGKARMERERGWEMSNWLYWVSGENGFWGIENITQGDGASLVLELNVADWPAPVAALEWLAERTGVTVDEVDFC
ncbi:hypothetical protein GCM10010287_36800 [Streptomyces variabilis]|uniref:YubB ferredoxin-like domain-containing protein n=1 Tax=Streptomyces variabilis TaxID=67372 RepID=A0ABQ2U2E0_9ACTN|nr:hypothetical protein GCM10010265_66650 [Streptomyces griseoincarnatus]GGT59227.1 hypothetical protein GCM10010287_36800 [Streptomyces variabilis]